jgi:MscS family membrane protein
LPELAKEFHALRPRFKGNIALLSDDPKGNVEAGLPPGEVRAGILAVGGKNTDIILVRVDDPESGKIWLVSKETVASIPPLYAQMQSEAPTVMNSIMQAAQARRHVLGLALGQWLGWLLSIPISWLLAWLLTFVLSAPRRIWYKLRKLPLKTIWETPLGPPLRCIIAILIHGFFVYLLEPPLLYRVYYFRFLAALLVGCVAWLVKRIRVAAFAGAAFDLELWAYGKTGDWGQFTAIRQDVILKIAEIVEAAVAAFAAPTRLIYVSAAGGVGAEKTNEIVRGVTDLRAGNVFRFPGETPTTTK